MYYCTAVQNFKSLCGVVEARESIYFQWVEHYWLREKHYHSEVENLWCVKACHSATLQQISKPCVFWHTLATTFHIPTTQGLKTIQARFLSFFLFIILYLTHLTALYLHDNTMPHHHATTQQQLLPHRQDAHTTHKIVPTPHHATSCHALLCNTPPCPTMSRPTMPHCCHDLTMTHHASACPALPCHVTATSHHTMPPLHPTTTRHVPPLHTLPQPHHGHVTCTLPHHTMLCHHHMPPQCCHASQPCHTTMMLLPLPPSI